jgi:hypothetical protein
MSNCFRAVVVLLLLLCPGPARGEVLVRWDVDQIPSRESLGISTILIPAAKPAAIRDALEKRYTVYLELENGVLPSAVPLDRIAGLVVRGSASRQQLTQLKQRLGARSARILSTEDRGKWPHVRLNWVTRSKDDVLQVSSRTAQPWLENNGALIRIAQRGRPDFAPLLVYPWTPITISDVHQGPALENYLVAIAEAGTFGSDLVLPLHEDFQRTLLLGRPVARADWQEIRRALEFYSWDLPRHYRPIANIGVVTSETMRNFELLNLLTRHNLPFVLITPDRLTSETTAGIDLLIALEEPAKPQVGLLSEFARKGGTVVLTSVAGERPWHPATPLQETEEHVSYRFGEGRVLELRQQVADPNAFAMQIREALGRDRRVVDVWNGITVLTALYEDASGDTLLLSVLNYAHDPLPVQLRVQGTFSTAYYETPGEEAVLLPLRHRGDHTEFVLPALRVGGRVFLTKDVAFD